MNDIILRWTPVTERLPEKYDSCIVTVEGSEDGNVFYRATDYADYDPDDGYIDGFNTVNDWIEGGEWHVTAWMHLPKAYEPNERISALIRCKDCRYLTNTRMPPNGTEYAKFTDAASMISVSVMKE